MNNFLELPEFIQFSSCMNEKQQEIFQILVGDDYMLELDIKIDLN